MISLMTALGDSKVSDIANTIKALVRLMVDEPELISLDAELTETGIALTVHVSAEDMGKLIGRVGRTARSLRVICSAIAETAGTKIYLEFSEGLQSR